MNPQNKTLDTSLSTCRDKLNKVKPFLEHLHAECKDNFNCGKNITIDEAMIPYKGKLSIKQGTMRILQLFEKGELSCC